MQNKVQILSTKKLLPTIIEQAKQMNIEIIEKEFISIKPISTVEKYEEIMPLILNSKTINVVFTSPNAVDVIKNYLHHADTWYVPDWNVFCLQGKTNDSLHPYINRNRILATAKNASGLAQKIIDFGEKEIVFFCGQNRRNELPEMLKNAGVNIHEIVVYETRETPFISDQAFDGILFFSPSAVKSFFSVNHLNKENICFAIGETTAAAIKEYTSNKIIISESQTQEMMLATINFYFQNSNCYE